MYISVCRTITLSVQSVWQMVLQGKILFQISVQCRAATQLLRLFSTRKPQVLFNDFPTWRSPTLPKTCWYYILQVDIGYHNYHTKIFPPIHHKNTHCDKISTKFLKFLFKMRFFIFFWMCTPNLILRIALSSPSPSTVFISRLNCRSIFQNILQNVVHS